MIFKSQLSVISDFLVSIHIDGTINWKHHVEHIIPKLSRACYIMRSIKPYVSINKFNIVYYSYFHSIMAYGLPFWGNSSHSIKAFRMQKYTICIKMGCKNWESYRKLFRKLKILPLASQYILSFMLFVINNKNQFTTISEIQNKNTRQLNHFHQPRPNLSKYLKGTS